MRQGFNPKTGETFRRLKMCSACLNGFHLSCADAECSCRKISHRDSAQQQALAAEVLQHHDTQLTSRSV